jgi:hypothetical protein
LGQEDLWHYKQLQQHAIATLPLTHWEQKKQGLLYQQVGSLDSRLGTITNGYKKPDLKKASSSSC